MSEDPKPLPVPRISGPSHKLATSDFTPSGRSAKTESRDGLFLSPAQLAEYAKVDSQLPILLVREAAELNRQNYSYSMLGLSCASLIQLALIGSSVYLFLNHEYHAAYTIFGGGEVSIVAMFLRARSHAGK